MTSPVWIVGAGQMARDHAAVFRAQGCEVISVCRTPGSAESFQAATGLPAISGGVDRALELSGGAPGRAVVAVTVGQLEDVARKLIRAGVGELLVEKPGGADADSIRRVADEAQAANASVHVAYNRRFYGSVAQARRGLIEDGGARSLHFDFSEAADRVLSVGHPPELLREWMLANSTHVIDTAFFLAGAPTEWSGTVAGSLPWHPAGARWAGHGATAGGALFSYAADWGAPGRWSIEVASSKHRYILKPMEKLQVQRLGSFAVEEVAPEDDLDSRFKPGLYRQAAAFLGGDGATSLVSIEEQAARVEAIYRRMLVRA